MAKRIRELSEMNYGRFCLLCCKHVLQSCCCQVILTGDVEFVNSCMPRALCFLPLEVHVMHQREPRHFFCSRALLFNLYRCHPAV